MRSLTALALVFLGSQPAWSLSCTLPSVARDFHFATDADEAYIVVKGDLFFDETGLPRPGFVTSHETKPGDIDAWLDGDSLTSDGFTRRFERDVTIRVTCHHRWCGRTSPGEHLLFLKKEGTGFVLFLSPCGSLAHRNPTADQITTVILCMQGDVCPAN